MYLLSFSTFRFLTDILQLVDAEIFFYYLLKSCFIFVVTERLIQVPNDRLWRFVTGI